MKPQIFQTRVSTIFSWFNGLVPDNTQNTQADLAFVTSVIDGPIGRVVIVENYPDAGHHFRAFAGGQDRNP